MYEIGSEFDLANFSSNKYIQDLFPKEYAVEYLRCGRDAIGYITDDFQKEKKK
ncbi:MAG: hypothetical protein WA125_15890 [Desulfosporosinus sp.]